VKNQKNVLPIFVATRNFLFIWPTAMIRPKSQNFKIGHDGILSIGNFILMIKNNILLFQLPGNLQTTKKCAPYLRGNTEFPIYLKILLKLPDMSIIYQFVR
jgi:hypothetical protein